MSLLQRLLRALGYVRIPQRTLQVDAELIQSLQDLAEREQRSEREVAANLLSQALAQREAAEVKIECWQSLTPREQQVAALTCLGFTNRQIAVRLVLSPETVKTHMRNALRKFGVRSKVELRRLLADWDFNDWR